MRDAAAALKAKEAGMAEMGEKFRELGGEVYVKGKDQAGSSPTDARAQTPREFYRQLVSHWLC